VTGEKACRAGRYCLFRTFRSSTEQALASFELCCTYPSSTEVRTTGHNLVEIGCISGNCRVGWASQGDPRCTVPCVRGTRWSALNVYRLNREWKRNNKRRWGVMLRAACFERMVHCVIAARQSVWLVRRRCLVPRCTSPAAIMSPSHAVKQYFFCRLHRIVENTMTRLHGGISPIFRRDQIRRRGICCADLVKIMRAPRFDTCVLQGLTCPNHVALIKTRGLSLQMSQFASSEFLEICEFRQPAHCMRLDRRRDVG